MKKAALLFLLWLPVLVRAQTVSTVVVDAAGVSNVSLSGIKVQIAYSIGEIIVTGGSCGTGDPFITAGFQQPDTFVNCKTDSSAIRETANDYTYFNIYPNPSQGLFHLKWSRLSSQEMSIRVFDVSGRNIWQRNATTDLDIDISGHPPGLYFIQVSGKNIEAVKKVCLQ